MAFQQPTRQQQQAPRLTHAGSSNGGSVIAAPTQPAPSESQTWVLFTPGTDAGTTTSYFSSAHDDGQHTPGRSQISDLGSLGTIAQQGSQNNASPSEALLDESIAATEDDAELDSLDSHLPEFRAGSAPYVVSQHEVSVSPQAATVFPSHDGLGSFRFEAPGGINAEVQDRLYAFERYNPNRIRLRAENFSLAQLEPESEEVQEAERVRRIEAWRLEQSRLLLEDIRKETRRRRLSEASRLSAPQRRASIGGASAAGGEVVEQQAVARSVADEEAAEINLGSTDWHEQDEPRSVADTSDGKQQPGLLSRIARKVICDLIGIDEKVLSLIFGPAPPAPDDKMLDDALPSEVSSEPDWQLRMLERISRELGILVHQMSAHPPGAFSTYTRVQHATLPYAGLPVIPETSAETATSETAARTSAGMGDSALSMPQFKPTVGRPATEPTAPSIPEAAAATSATAGDSLHQQHTFTQQEWEQDLDIRLVFRYLRSRFASSRQAAPAPASNLSTSTSTSTSTSPSASSTSLHPQDVAAKAARVRQHHPLVSHAYHHHLHHHHHHFHHHHHHHRPRPAERARSMKPAIAAGSGATGGAVSGGAAGAGSGSPVAAAAAVRYTAGPGSCASQSTRRSATRRSSISSRHSSRHYWDIGGSVASGSVIASTGVMGSWGEV
ncbi:hypothetical protein VTJ04DRAFT_8289 [Mycothermus thermophilus]|uniref:uncharacterized protein n=1 Tax=Humicola insolens TaxID=85995 RepID=UPI0037431280